MAILTNRNGTMTAVKVIRETEKAWKVFDHSSHRERRVPKTDRVAMFDCVEAALAFTVDPHPHPHPHLYQPSREI